MLNSKAQLYILVGKPRNSVFTAIRILPSSLVFILLPPCAQTAERDDLPLPSHLLHPPFLLNKSVWARLLLDTISILFHP